MVQHLHCRVVRERAIEFDSHMSGFVYKVRVDGRMLIKKEIPGPDSVDEFLYEVNALNVLSNSRNVIEFYGVIVDDKDCVTGLLIDFAEQGALIDIIYDNEHGIPWPTRAKWARQIVQGLSEIHEAGYVQGDFTLSNIVIDDDGNAKIIDINRRGCPVGWEPPEATPLIENKQRISMYIGVKSDLYQLGMVLWALTMQDDEPEAHPRPLHLSVDVTVPSWFRTIVETCLQEDPRARAQARQLVRLFPVPKGRSEHSDFSDYDDIDWVGDRRPPVLYEHSSPPIRLGDDAASLQHEAAARGPVGYPEDAGAGMDIFPADGVTTSSTDWSYVNLDPAAIDSMPCVSNTSLPYPPRGRSPHPKRRSHKGNPHHRFLGKPNTLGIERETSNGSDGGGKIRPASHSLRADNSNQLRMKESLVVASNERDSVAPTDRPTVGQRFDGFEERQISGPAELDLPLTERQRLNDDARPRAHAETKAETPLAVPDQPNADSLILEAKQSSDSESISPNRAPRGSTALKDAHGTAHHVDKHTLADDEHSVTAVD